ncbi:MAG: hypothetical protein KTR28_08035 [Micavibrio sp.]|nr:hypothetical protein [Micavibrio sp.]
MSKALPREITSYDLLKTFAIITMIVDHIGYYFFPDQLWWRAIGRTSAPVWLFLIGYAQSRDLSLRMWVGASVLTASKLVIGKYFLQLNILWGMILTRLMLDKVAPRVFSASTTMTAFLVIMAVLYIPTSMIFDYGAFCLMVAVFGFGVRQYRKDGLYGNERLMVYGFMCALLYSLGTVITFGFSELQIYFVAGSILAVHMVLYFFKPLRFEMLTAALPSPIVGLLHLTGRRTLEIYVIHILTFKVIAYYMGMENFGLFALFQP